MKTTIAFSSIIRKLTVLILMLAAVSSASKDESSLEEEASKRPTRERGVKK